MMSDHESDDQRRDKLQGTSDAYPQAGGGYMITNPSPSIFGNPYGYRRY